MPDFATVPDLLRLLVIPFFGYVAWRDVKTRRVPNRTWYPLAILAVVLLVWEGGWVVLGDAAAFQQRQFLVRAAFSIGFVIPLSYMFWWIGGFGGADAKAFFVIAVLFPTYPTYQLWRFGVDGALMVFPVVQSDIGIFSITILSNTVLAGVFYPVALAGRNAVTGYLSPGMFVAKPIQWDEATAEYGTMLEFAEGSLLGVRSLAALRAYFSWRSLDLDALRMYLQWRGCTLAELRENPEQFRDPASLPEEPNPPGDGSMATVGSADEPTDAATDGGEPVDDTDATADTERTDASDDEQAEEDPWGAEAFLDDIEGSAYGTTPDVLREGLEELTTADVVWISPGIPFLVPLFAGILVSFIYGDVLFKLLQTLGLIP